MLFYNDWAVIVPMVNKAQDFHDFMAIVRPLFDRLEGGKMYFVVDRVSKDNTLDLCRETSAADPRFVTVWAPENRNVVDDYLRGYRAAYEGRHEIIIEMDAGLGHDPRAIPMFLRMFNEGNECAVGSRFCNGGSMADSSPLRKNLSRTGTFLSKWLLGTNMYDMTSGFQGFHRSVLERLLAYPLLSKAHFYQTEVRYLLRKHRDAEIPIHYRSPSKSVSRKAIYNALQTLMYYFGKRLTFQAISL